MSVEITPAPTAETNQSEYAAALKKQQLESQILSGGEHFDQSRVDTLFAQAALDGTVEAPQAHPVAEAMISQLTITPEEVASEDVVAEAALRQKIDMDTLYAKQDLQERAARESWPEDKYQAELSKL